MRAPRARPLSRFRVRLTFGMMLGISSLTSVALYVEGRRLTDQAEQTARDAFAAELAGFHRVQDLRSAALRERCRALARRPRLHAALEDGALDLLYPSAKDELRDLMEREDIPDGESGRLHARFYRFLDPKGMVIAPNADVDAGNLPAEEQAHLSLGTLTEEPQLGYLARPSDSGATVDEVVAMPIASSETGEVISALVIGFKATELRDATDRGLVNGLWIDGKFIVPAGAAPIAPDALAKAVAANIKNAEENGVTVGVAGASYLLCAKRLNPGSSFAPAFEACLYPLSDALAQKRRAVGGILTAGAVLLAAGFAVSHVIAGRLATPVEQLEAESAEDRTQRLRAEANLERTSRELQRSARFSADTSHQLKTPVTVLRAGLDELIARAELSSEVKEELAELVHQTYRLSSIIEDLLLLSRMDAGRLQLQLVPLNLSELIEGCLDDLDAVADSCEIEIEKEIASPGELFIMGEKRYTSLIIQNLFENARKYNRKGGRVRIGARRVGDDVVCTIGNTGREIAPEAREHIFERFHRGSAAEDIPGHGLGLNLARELARLHGGDLWLERSGADWTELGVRFRIAQPRSEEEGR